MKVISITERASGILLVLLITFLAANFLRCGKVSNEGEKYGALDYKDRVAYYRKTHPTVEIIENEDINKKKDLVHQYKIEKVLQIGGNSDDPKEYIFGRIIGVDCDSESNIYVADIHMPIRKYAPDGKYLLTLGKTGPAPSELTGPYYIYISDKDTVYAFCSRPYKVIKYMPDGTYAGTITFQNFSTEEFPDGFIVDNDNNFIFTIYYEKSKTIIHVFNQKGRLVRTFGEPIKTKGETKFDYKLRSSMSDGHLCIDHNRYLFSLGNPYEIREYDKTGELRKVCFRKNDFMPVFRIIIKKDSQTYTTYTYNSGINVFDDHIINTTIQTRKNGIPQRSTAIDFYHKDLRLIDSYLLENVSVHFKKVAGEGMFIGSQASFVEIPRVVIYRLIKLP